MGFRKAILLLACVMLMSVSAYASATNIYIAQNTAGAANGADCADAKPVSFFNNAGNWGSGSNQIGPGTTVHLCGTFTGAPGSTMLTIQGSGASGSPVTILFEPGAVLQAPYWGGDPYSGGPGAIVCNEQSYITIDGGTNGVVKNTANGTGMTYQNPSTGVYVSSCPYFTISGSLTISPIYVHREGDAKLSGSALWVQSSDHFSISGATLENAFVPLNIGFGSGSAAVTSGKISNNVIDHGCHLFVVGDETGNSSASGVSIVANTIGPHNQEWADPAAGCHQDGLFLQSSNSGSAISNFFVYDNLVQTDMCSDRSYSANNCTSPFFISGVINSSTIFNNVIRYTTTTGGWEGMIRLDAISGNQSNDAFYNNTFDENGAGGGQSCDCAAIKFTSDHYSQSGMVVANNIFLNGDNFHAALMTSDGSFSAKLSQVNNNDYSGYSNVAYQGSTGTTFTLGSWQAAGWDANSASANPLLTAAYILGPTSSILNLGRNLTQLGITPLDSDRAGTSRPSAGPWSPGAYQSGGTTQAPAPPLGLTATVQ